MQHTLTTAYLNALKPPAGGRIEIVDSKCFGLAIRITSAGIMSWSFRYRARGNVVRLTIGKYPALGLSAARSKANAMRERVAAGDDPAVEVQEQRSSRRSFGHLAERYLAEHARRHKRSHAADERNLRKHVLPKWKNKDFKAIRRADVDVRDR